MNIFVKAIKSINKATVSYEEWYAIRDGAAWGDLDRPAVAIDGGTIPAEVQKALKIQLNSGVYYVFRRTLKGGYQPARVTMSKKTMENYSKGWSKYGSESFVDF